MNIDRDVTMKAVILIITLIFMILSIQIVSAAITFDPFSQPVYNLGDKIFISGNVQRDDATRANLNLNLNCETGNSKILSVLVDIDKGESQMFSQLVLVPKNVLGKCTIAGELIDELTNTGLESFSADAFTVTDDLKGSFEIVKESLQLGDVLNIRGSASKQDGIPVDGLGVFYFNKDGNISFLDSVNIRNGLLDYSRDMGYVPPGKYNIDLEVSDNLGNKHLFSNLYSLDVSGNILISSSFSNKIYLPGDNTELSGFVSGLYKNVLNNIELKFEFDDGNKVERVLSNGASSFSVVHSTAKNIKSGSHEIKISAKADGGNYGISTVNFTIQPVATTLGVKTNKNSFVPEEDVGFTVDLLDQAGDKMGGSATVSFSNDNKLAASNVFNANSNGNLKLPAGAKPGVWVLRAEALGLKNEVQFNVDEFKKLDIDLKDEKLFVINKGNVEYNDEVLVAANELTGKKKLNLDVGDIKELNLDGLFPEGVYNVKILDKEFNDFLVKDAGLFGGLSSLTGNVAKNLEGSQRKTWLGLLVLLVLGCGLFLVFKKKGKLSFGRSDYFSDFSGKKYDEIRRKADYEDGQRMADELRRKGIRKDKPAGSYEYGKASPEDVEDFKIRMKDMFADQKEKEDNPKGGLMNMFG